MRAHFLGAECAVETDGNGARMAHRIPESSRRLPGEQPSRSVRDSAGNHHRHADATFFRDFPDCVDRSLRIERIEYSLDQKQIDAAIDEALDLLRIGEPQFIER